MSLKEVARETLKILEDGQFTTPSGKVVTLAAEQKWAFGQWLDSPEFTGCFDRVIFGVYDPSKTKNTPKAFQSQFS